MIKAVIFDMDGVIIDSENVNIEAAVRVFERHDRKITDKEKEMIYGRHGDDHIPDLIRHFDIDVGKTEELKNLHRETYRAIWEDTVELMPDIQFVMGELKTRGITLALATSSTLRFVEKMKEILGLGDIFPIVVTTEDVKKRKPDPEMYNVTKAKLNCEDSEILVIEDTSVGVESAKAAGLKCAAVPNQHTRDQDFSRADYVLDSLKDILKIVDKK